MTERPTMGGDGLVEGFEKLTRVQQIDIERHIRGLSEGPETYDGPRHGWTCFHCGETFKTEDGARLHFGERVTGRPACFGDRAAIEAAIHKHVKVQWSGRGMDAGYRRIGVEKAADEILASLTTSEALVTSLRNQLEGAKEALEPFGDISGEGDEDYPDDAPVQVHFGRSTHYALKLGDLRLAASTLDQLDEKINVSSVSQSAAMGPQPRIAPEAEPSGEEFLEFKEALSDLRSLRQEHRDLTGGGPDWMQRWLNAWVKADELFANEDEAAWCRQQEDAHG